MIITEKQLVMIIISGLLDSGSSAEQPGWKTVELLEALIVPSSWIGLEL